MQVHYQCHSRSKRHETIQMTPGNEHLQGRMNGLEGALCNAVRHSTIFMTRFFSVFFSFFDFLFLCFVLFFYFIFLFVLGGNCKDRGQRQGDGKINGTGKHDAKATKNQ